MMKTQLYRVKQMAAQKVGRAEKTDLLTEDLYQVEKTVEKVKIACTTVSKKLNACMLSSGPDIEKRKKKLNQLQLGQGLVESSAVLGDKSLLGGIMLKAGEAQSAISGELATYETELDGQVLAPLQNLTEIQIPNIAITKKKLSVARLDMDACKTRWQNAVKVSNGTSGNRTEALAKAELLKSEYEDQTILFHQLQDQLATEMLTFVAGERTYAQWTVKVLEAQMRYHQASLDILKETLPIVEQQMEDAMFRPTFGCPLAVHLRIKDRKIALVIEECILFLLDNAMDVQGLFRLAGSSSKIKKLKASLNIGYADMEEYECDVHAVTGVLKLYLRELPEPLLTFELYHEWIATSLVKESEVRLERIKELVNRLPHANRMNLRYLICFLARIAENSEENKMSPSNIAIVVGPNLLWSPDDGGVSVATTGNVSAITEVLIESCQHVFPEGCEFTRHQLDEERHDSANSRFDKKGSESPSPEHTSASSGNIFSDIPKLFNRKEGAGDKKILNMGVQGYYNPVAAKTEADPVINEEESHNHDKKLEAPPSPHLNTPSNSHKRSLSGGIFVPPPVADKPGGVKHSSSSANDFVESPHNVKRSNSTGTEKKDVPRRPAPPVPKYPPTAPPKSKPPDPPKEKPPEPPKSCDSRNKDSNLHMPRDEKDDESSNNLPPRENILQ